MQLGALYEDNTTGIFKLDEMVPPGGVFTYNWSLPIKFGIDQDDDDCVPWAYHSHVNTKKDVESGLVGLITTCRKGNILLQRVKDKPFESCIIWYRKMVPLY